MHDAESFLSTTDYYRDAPRLPDEVVNALLRDASVLALLGHLGLNGHESTVHTGDDVWQPNHHHGTAMDLETEHAFSAKRGGDTARDLRLSLCGHCPPIYEEGQLDQNPFDRGELLNGRAAQTLVNRGGQLRIPLDC